MAIGLASAWSNHFQSSFHLDDRDTILENSAVHRITNIPRFFADPGTFSALPEHDAYRPLLSTSFAIDYRIAGANTAFFQLEDFLWFVVQLLVLYWLFRLVPGGTHGSSLLAAALYGFHPVAAETVNYPLQRGAIFGALGVAGGMALWITWPRRMPPQIKWRLPKIPTNDLQLWIMKNSPRISAWYERLLRAPLPLYFIPVILAMLADPNAAVFAPMLVIYIVVCEPEIGLRRAIPAAIVCGGYWIFECLFTWKFGASFRLPAFGYWITQPWVAMRYVYSFFVPVHLSSNTDLQPFTQFWSPFAIAGYAGLAALVYFAIITGRRKDWRGVSFGLWWFLIALAPQALVPQREVESISRMFLPMAGLALAVARAGWILFTRMREPAWLRAPVTVSGAVIAGIALGACGWETYERNRVWQTDETLWSDILEKSPRNGRAFMYNGLFRMSYDADGGFRYLSRAAALAPHDPEVELNLALACEKLNRDSEIEGHFRKAIALMPDWPQSHAAYAEWLLNQKRVDEAFNMSVKAQRLDGSGIAGRRTLMDIYALRHNWAALMNTAQETLRINPEDQDAQRSLEVAQDGIDEIRRVEKVAKTQPSPDHYLSLSVVYFRNAKYEDCIAAAREALKIMPNTPEAYSNIANAYFAMGKLDDAIAAFREAHRLGPNLVQIKNNLDYLLALRAARESKQ